MSAVCLNHASKRNNARTTLFAGDYLLKMCYSLLLIFCRAIAARFEYLDPHLEPERGVLLPAGPLFLPEPLPLSLGHHCLCPSTPGSGGLLPAGLCSLRELLLPAYECPYYHSSNPEEGPLLSVLLSYHCISSFHPRIL